ncbi:MAG: hypothetical protein ACI9WU_004035 [Myxococcota bacterium]|jgi:hypothetical protein
MKTSHLLLFAVSVVLAAGFTAAVRGTSLANAAEEHGPEHAPSPEAAPAETPATETPAAVDDSAHMAPTPQAAPMAEEKKKPEISIRPEKKGDVIDLNNSHCPVMGGKSADDVFIDYKGLRVHFCCPGCDSTFKEDAAAGLAKMGITDIAAFKLKHGLKPTTEKATTGKPTPDKPKQKSKPAISIKPEKKGDVIDLNNSHCPVMGGKASPDVFIDYEGLRVHFCCPGCDSTFKEDAAAGLAKMGITDIEAFKRQHGAGK